MFRVYHCATHQWHLSNALHVCGTGWHCVCWLMWVWRASERARARVHHIYSCFINILWIQLCVVISFHSYMERRTVNVSRIEIETVIRYFRCNCEQYLGLIYTDTQCAVCARLLPLTSSNALSLFTIRLEWHITRLTFYWIVTPSNSPSLSQSLFRIIVFILFFFSVFFFIRQAQH